MLSRDDVGRVVRETWEAWAREQPDVAEHPSWLVPWESLPERDREVDMRIGDAVTMASFSRLRADVERLTRELREARAALMEYAPKCNEWGKHRHPASHRIEAATPTYACDAHVDAVVARERSYYKRPSKIASVVVTELPHAPAIRAAEGET